MKSIFVISFLSITLFSLYTFGQENDIKYEAKFGYGFYQGFNIGINYFYCKNLDAGIGVGTHFNLPPLESPNHFNISIENNLHFGSISKQGIKACIFNQQLMYWEQGPSSDRWRILSLGLNIGRIFALKEKLGLSLEIGPAFNLVVDVKRDPHTPDSGWIWPVLYNGRAQVIYLF
ncbi:hypothetical protein ACFLTA_05295 [Bacteroidota bacterium]